MVGKQQDAEIFLKRTLCDGPIACRDLINRAAEAGHSEKTLRRAKTAVGVESVRQGFGAGGEIIWRLPKTAATSAGSTEPTLAQLLAKLILIELAAERAKKPDAPSKEPVTMSKEDLDFLLSELEDLKRRVTALEQRDAAPEPQRHEPVYEGRRAQEPPPVFANLRQRNIGEGRTRFDTAPQTGVYAPPSYGGPVNRPGGANPAHVDSVPISTFGRGSGGLVVKKD